MVRRRSTVRVRQKASRNCLLSSLFVLGQGPSAAVADVPCDQNVDTVASSQRLDNVVAVSSHAMVAGSVPAAPIHSFIHSSTCAQIRGTPAGSECHSCSSCELVPDRCRTNLACAS